MQLHGLLFSARELLLSFLPLRPTTAASALQRDVQLLLLRLALQCRWLPLLLLLFQSSLQSLLLSVLLLQLVRH